MNTAKDTTATGARRTLKVLKALKGSSLIGISNVDLARQLNESPANISRACAVLAEEGLVTKLDNGRWALGIVMLQIATSYTLEMNTMSNKINELQQRVLSGAQR